MLLRAILLSITLDLDLDLGTSNEIRAKTEKKKSGLRIHQPALIMINNNKQFL